MSAMLPAVRRLRSAILAAALCLAPGLALAGGADKLFLIDSSDGYGIDACIASGATCGQAMADAWCRVHDYERAVNFGTVKSDAVLGSVGTTPVRTACYGSNCQDSVAITCTR